MDLYCNGMSTVHLLQSSLGQYEDWLLFFSHFGDPRNNLLILFPLTYSLSTSLGLKVLWTSAIVEWFNAILKWLFRDDRPYWWHSEDCSYSAEQLKQYSITCESGPGFPSGHVMANSALGLLLIMHVYSLIRTKRKWTFLYLFISLPIFISIISLVAISRVYIATHFPHQVITGALAGCGCAVLINNIFDRYSTNIMFSWVAMVTGLTSLLAGITVYYTLAQLDLDPLATVELALNNCVSRDWVHLDTTLFFSITRTAGCLSGLGFTSLFVSNLLGFQARQLILEGKLPIPIGLVCAGILCPLVLYLETFQISQKKLSSFYALGFMKFLSLPGYVVTVKCIFELACEWVYKAHKCKKHSC